MTMMAWSGGAASHVPQVRACRFRDMRKWSMQLGGVDKPLLLSAFE